MSYKIDKTDLRILFELDKNSRIPETKLAKIIEKSKEVVRYRIKKLIEEKIILNFTIWIDPIKLGYQTAKIYLKLANIPEKRKRFLDYVKKDKRLFWLGIADGAWNIGLTFFVRDNKEFFEIKNEIFSKFKDLIIENTTASVVGVYYHDKTFLFQDKTDFKSMFESSSNLEIDEISRKILKELFGNSRINIVSIANKYNTSVDIIKSRIKKLEEQKIISRYTISINYQKLNYEFYKTFLYFENLNETELEKLMQYCKENKNIIHLIKQISPWDIELEIMCQNYNEYNKIISNLTEKFSDIITKVETAIMGEDYIFPAKKMIFE